MKEKLSAFLGDFPGTSDAFVSFDQLNFLKGFFGDLDTLNQAIKIIEDSFSNLEENSMDQISMPMISKEIKLSEYDLKTKLCIVYMLFLLQDSPNEQVPYTFTLLESELGPKKIPYNNFKILLNQEEVQNEPENPPVKQEILGLFLNYCYSKKENNPIHHQTFYRSFGENFLARYEDLFSNQENIHDMELFSRFQVFFLVMAAHGFLLSINELPLYCFLNKTDPTLAKLKICINKLCELNYDFSDLRNLIIEWSPDSKEISEENEGIAKQINGWKRLINIVIFSDPNNKDFWENELNEIAMIEENNAPDSYNKEDTHNNQKQNTLSLINLTLKELLSNIQEEDCSSDTSESDEPKKQLTPN